MPTNWSRSKEIVKENYSNVKEGSEEFYRLTMGAYKDMTKCASEDETISSLYKEGVLSKHAYDVYKEEKQYMDIVHSLFNNEKQAGWWGNAAQKVKGSFVKKEGGPTFLGNLSGSLLGGAALAAGSAGVLSGSRAIANSIRKYRTEKGRPEHMKQIMKFNPSLKEMDPTLAEEGMRTLESLNPEFAKSPLIAGSYLKSVHHFGLTPEMANILQKKDDGRKTVTEGFGRQVGTAKDILTKKSSNIKEAAGDGIDGMSLKNMMLTTLAGAGVTAGAIAGAKGLGKLTDMIGNKITRNHRIESVKTWNPDLKKADPKLLNQGMKSLERLSPIVSKDPLASGGYLRNIISKKGLVPAKTKELADIHGNTSSDGAFTTASKAFGYDPNFEYSVKRKK